MLRRRRFGALSVPIRAEFDHAIFGNVMQTSADALYGARHVAIKSGTEDRDACSAP